MKVSFSGHLFSKSDLKCFLSFGVILENWWEKSFCQDNHSKLIFFLLICESMWKKNIFLMKDIFWGFFCNFLGFFYQWKIVYTICHEMFFQKFFFFFHKISFLHFFLVSKHNKKNNFLEMEFSQPKKCSRILFIKMFRIFFPKRRKKQSWTFFQKLQVFSRIFFPRFEWNWFFLLINLL